MKRQVVVLTVQQHSEVCRAKNVKKWSRLLRNSAIGKTQFKVHQIYWINSRETDFQSIETKNINSDSDETVRGVKTNNCLLHMQLARDVEEESRYHQANSSFSK